MTTIPAGGFLRDRTLVTLADAVDDLEAMRKATDNRIRILTAPAEPDADGVIRGHGRLFDASVDSLRQTAAIVATEEKRAVRSLEKAMKSHPLGDLVVGTKGMGLKTTARALSAIGDPYWNDLHDRPRTVSELWAFCGLHVVDGRGAKRTKGVKSNWSATAKTRLYNMAAPAVKCSGPYRDIYDAEVSRYSDCDHPEGLAGNWCRRSADDEPIRHAHRMARAMRKMEKAMLKDLWRAARDEYARQGWDVSGDLPAYDERTPTAA